MYKRKMKCILTLVYKRTDDFTLLQIEPIEIKLGGTIASTDRKFGPYRTKRSNITSFLWSRNW